MVYEHKIPGKYILIFSFLMFAARPIGFPLAHLDFFDSITKNHHLKIHWIFPLTNKKA